MRDSLVVRFTVPGKAVPKGRARAARHGRFIRHYTPEQTVTYESTVAQLAAQAMAGKVPESGPVELTVEICIAPPQSWSKKRRHEALNCEIAPTRKPDSSNVLKSIEDACNQIVWCDDSQIVAHRMIKRYSDKPSVVVAVHRLNARSAP